MLRIGDIIELIHPFDCEKYKIKDITRDGIICFQHDYDPYADIEYYTDIEPGFKSWEELRESARMEWLYVNNAQILQWDREWEKV